jgi:PPK2 family polyphosphate:nucleotide phosphotransferase
MNIDLDRLRAEPGKKIHLDQWDPADTSAYKEDKDDAQKALDDLALDLAKYQERLYAEHKHAILIVLQGMDTSGKDGTVKHVFDGANPEGVKVANFKVPTPLELEHDFLWRVHQKTPGKGEMVIFNRSHYEDVLVVRVHHLVPDPVWRQRYEEINHFERLLADEGATILKFFLHISKGEQKQRLLDRLNEPDKHWKFNPGDLAERDLWGDYMQAYQDALEATSTDWAPWYIVPADHKWYRNLVVAALLVKTLKDLDPMPTDPFTEADIQKYTLQLQQNGKAVAG